MQQSKGGVLSMLIVAALLTGFGFWQFGTVGLGDGEFEHEESFYRSDRYSGQAGPGSAAAMLNGIAEQRGWRIVKQEAERKNGRPVYELKLLDGAGGRHKLVVDARSGEVIEERY